MNGISAYITTGKPPSPDPSSSPGACVENATVGLHVLVSVGFGGDGVLLDPGADVTVGTGVSPVPIVFVVGSAVGSPLIGSGQGVTCVAVSRVGGEGVFMGTGVSVAFSGVLLARPVAVGVDEGVTGVGAGVTGVGAGGGVTGVAIGAGAGGGVTGVAVGVGDVTSET